LVVVVAFVVVVDDPPLDKYFMPVAVHEPFDGASTGIHRPSSTDPLRL
jgi:hypothetical protein